jgi:hypothetical protein
MVVQTRTVYSALLAAGPAHAEPCSFCSVCWIAQSSVVGQFLRLWIWVQAIGPCCACPFHKRARPARLHCTTLSSQNLLSKLISSEYNFFFPWYAYSSEFTFCLCKSLNGRQKSTILSVYAHKHPNDAKLLFATSICIKANMSY